MRVLSNVLKNVATTKDIAHRLLVQVQLPLNGFITRLSVCVRFNQVKEITKMGMDNKFLLLSSEKACLEELVDFIDLIKDSDANDNSEHRLCTYKFNIAGYGNYWGLEGTFRNSDPSDLWYWLDFYGRTELLAGTYFLIRYQDDDFVELVHPGSDRSPDDIMDLETYDLMEAGEQLEGVLDMQLIRHYFTRPGGW